VPAPLLDVERLAKHFPTGSGGTLEVLRGVDMTLAPGEIVAVMGASGSGKSTLLHLLGGLDRPTAGTVRYRGDDLFAKTDDELARFRSESIGFVFQFHHLLPEFTALENVAMPALIRHRPLREVRERARMLLATLGLADRAGHQPSALSGGEKQRVAIARALMNQPGLVLADEPTGNLDAATAEPLHDEIVRLSRSFGQAFVLVTHSDALAAIADRILRLERGRLRGPEEAEEAGPDDGDPGETHGSAGEGARGGTGEEERGGASTA
jgi:lipoprotein-releasing system ATP-binding protein